MRIYSSTSIKNVKHKTQPAGKIDATILTSVHKRTKPAEAFRTDFNASLCRKKNGRISQKQ